MMRVADRSYRLLLLVGILAILLRLSIVGFFGPRAGPLHGDSKIYFTTAQSLAASAGAWLKQDSEFGYRAPLYFIYLAAVDRILPQSGYLIAQVATALLGVLCSLLLYWIAVRAGSAPTAKIAFALRAFLPCFFVPDTFVMTEPLFDVLLLGSLLALVSMSSVARWQHAAVLGSLNAGCMLTREAATGYPLIFAAALVVFGRGTRQRFSLLLAYGLGLLLVLSPWVVRNKTVHGHALPLSYTSGLNLHLGNHALAAGGYVEVPPLPPHLHMATPEASAWHTEHAVNYIREHPVRFVLNGFKKVAVLCSPSFRRHEMSRVYFASPRALLTAVSLLSGGASVLLMIGGLIGLVLKPRDCLWWVSLAIIAYHLGAAFVTYGNPRYREPVDNILVYYAAWLIAVYVASWPKLRPVLAKSNG